MHDLCSELFSLAVSGSQEEFPNQPVLSVLTLPFSYVCNEEAISLFRANSTHLNEQKKRTRRKQRTPDETIAPPPSLDPFLNYKKLQLVTRLRNAQQHIQDLERQLTTLADACLRRDALVVQLQTKLAELEPYQSFVEQMRLRVRQEEQNP